MRLHILAVACLFTGCSTTYEIIVQGTPDAGDDTGRAGQHDASDESTGAMSETDAHGEDASPLQPETGEGAAVPVEAGAREAACTPVVPSPIKATLTFGDASFVYDCQCTTPTCWGLVEANTGFPSCEGLQAVPTECQCQETYNCGCLMASGAMPDASICSVPPKTFGCSETDAGGLIVTCGH